MDWGWIVGLGLASLAALAGLLHLSIKTWLTTFVEGAVNTRFEKELEELRSDLRRKEAEIGALQANVLGGRAGRQALLDKRRVESIEKLWLSTLKLNQFHGSVTMIGLIKLEAVDKHIEEEHTHKVKEFLQTLVGKDLDEKLSDFGLDEECRLYVPTQCWKLFKAYKGFLLFCYMRLRAASKGVGGKYFKDEYVINEIKEILPHFSDYLDKWGLAGAAQLADRVRDLLFESLRAALNTNEDDVANVAATRAIMKLVCDLDAQVGSSQGELNLPTPPPPR